jgi:hypothetical protein
MPTPSPTVIDPHAPAVYRRTTTLVWAGVLAAVFFGLGILIGTAYVHNGVFSALAPLAAVTPLLAFALMGLAWPSVVLQDAAMTVRNTYTTYVIPYGLIKEVIMVRIGMFVLVHDGPKVPITAYASGGNSARAFGHKKSSGRLVDAIEDKMSWAPADVGDAAVTRTINIRNIIITVAALVVPALVIFLAVLTYHH